jgi:glucokinase
MGLGNAITIIAPDVLIIGGGISSAGNLLLDPLREMVPTFVSMIPPECIKIVPAALGSESGLYGAVALARSTTFKGSDPGAAVFESSK